LLIGHVSGCRDRPVRQLRKYVQRRRASRVKMRVAQARENLMERVPRDSYGPPSCHKVFNLFRLVRKRAYQSGFVSVLTFLQLADDIVASLLERIVGGGGIHQRAGGQVMPQSVSVRSDVRPSLDRFPSTVDRRLRLKSGVDAEIVQQSIRL